MNAIYESELYHHGIKGQKWGVRRYENADGTLTPTGKKRYEKQQTKELNKTYRRYGNVAGRYRRGMNKQLKKIESDKFNKYSEDKQAKILAKMVNKKIAYDMAAKVARDDAKKEAAGLVLKSKKAYDAGKIEKSDKLIAKAARLAQREQAIGKDLVAQNKIMQKTLTSERENIIKGRYEVKAKLITTKETTDMLHQTIGVQLQKKKRSNTR